MDAKREIAGVDRERALVLCVTAVMALIEGRPDEARERIGKAAELLGAAVREEGEAAAEAEGRAGER